MTAVIFLVAQKCPLIEADIKSRIMKQPWDSCIMLLTHYETSICIADQAKHALLELRGQTLSSQVCGKLLRVVTQFLSVTGLFLIVNLLHRQSRDNDKT